MSWADELCAFGAPGLQADRRCLDLTGVHRIFTIQFWHALRNNLRTSLLQRSPRVWTLWSQESDQIEGFELVSVPGDLPQLF